MLAEAKRKPVFVIVTSMVREHLIELDDDVAVQYLETELGKPIVKLDWFKKGYYSRAALVESENGEKLVAKFGNAPLGYQKDQYAASHFVSQKVPIPTVKTIKQVPNGMWLCISEYVDGAISDDLHGDKARAAITSVQEALVAIHSTPINDTQGYGDFDVNGYADSLSWAEFLTRDFCTEKFYGDKTINTALIKQAWAMVNELAQLCPSERFLVHGDFGADNLLINDSKVVAVLDWNFGLFGDWATDVANCEKYPREVYGDLKAAHEKSGFNTSNWAIRMNCYRIRSQIGLVQWLWERQVQGIPSWQGVAESLNDLRLGLLQVESGGMYGKNLE